MVLPHTPSFFGRTGRRVNTAARRSRRLPLEPSQTVIALDQWLTSADVETLRSFVRAGGELVTGGANPGRWLATCSPTRPVVGQWRPVAATNTIDGVHRVVTPATVRFTATGLTGRCSVHRLTDRS